VTDRAAVASRPDETSVEDLPLRRYTIVMLRAEDVPTLGALRAMHDDELLLLPRFGARSLADVRRLVPPPAADAGREVVIAGRAFRLGAVYARRPGGGPPGPCPPRRLLRHGADSPLPGGRVTGALMPSGRQHIMAGEEWAAWAGEPVGDGSR
jgi:hypothetical protein